MLYIIFLKIKTNYISFYTFFNLKSSQIKGILRKIISQVLQKLKAKDMLNTDISIKRKVNQKNPDSIQEETSKTHFSFLDNQ